MVHRLYEMHYIAALLQSLEGATFLEGSIISWQMMEQVFLKQSYNTQKRVGMPELIETKQRDDETITDFITRWRGLTFECPQKFTQGELVGTCLSNFKHDFSIAPMSQTFEGLNDLCMKAHAIEIHLVSARKTLKEVVVKQGFCLRQS